METSVVRNGVLYKIRTISETAPDPIASLNAHKPIWDRAATDEFVNECVKEKLDLQNPSIRRLRIFHDIHFKMKAKGYNFSAKFLDRKFRNLKTHFFFLKAKNKIKNRKRIIWPYYKRMDEIFPEETMRDTRIKRLLNSNCSQTQNLSKEQEAQVNDTEEGGVNSVQNKSLECMRNELLVFEERRTKALEGIAEELKEANRLTQNKIEFERRKLEEKIVYLDLL